MASHFVVYRRLSDSKPAACDADADRAQRLATSISPLAKVTRLLTGYCPMCGRGVSRLAGAGMGFVDPADGDAA